VTQDNPAGPEAGDSSRSGADDPFVAEALDWFVRLQAAGGDPVTSRAFRAWLDGDPRRAAAFEKITEVWGAPEFLQATKNVAKATGFVAPRKKSRRRSLAKKAAAIATAIIVAFALSQTPDLTLRLRADYVTSAGEQRVVALPDGSQMTLNTGSAVALDFAEGQRDVRVLKGEAYFDVRSGLPVPFRVAGHFGNVEVKGTAFSVKLDNSEDNVVLSRGVVEVANRAQPQEHALLSPGEMVSVTATSISPVRKIDTERSLAWLEGRIRFDDRPFGEVLNDLRRYYPGRIFVANSAVERVSVSGNYKLDQPLLVVRSLAEAAGATVTTLPGGIVILR
jgi:transmembrane sensor